MAKTLFIISSLIFLSLHFPFIQSSSSNPDFQTLMAFKTASDKTNHLTNWNKTTHPCSWYGVSCLQNRVSRLVLEGLNLHGSFETLTSLNQLRLLSLKRNHLSGPIPDLSNFTALKLLFLSHNQFSGEFPPSLPFLLRLYRLDLSYNNLSGQIPANVNHLSHLLTLRLEENQFSGPISRLNIPNLQDFNVSRNHLSGEIPKSLSGFPETAFGGNLVLCGPPLASCKDVVSDPSKPGSDGALASPVTPVTGSPAMVASSPSSIPEVSQSTTTPSSNARRTKGSKLSVLAVVAIIIGDILVLALISGILFCYFWKTNKMAGNRKRSSQLRETEKIVYSSSPYTSQGGILERGKMVFFEEHHQKRFELEDLLRASAEMLGKGGFGTAYKAILDDGNVVAVKRLKETNLSAAAAGGGVNNEIKRIFDQHMEILGRLRHPNLVSLMAYYYGRDEKLLVYEYMPNGSLFWLLHGNRGPGRTPLDWTTRLKIASGAARGLAFLHHHSSNRTASSSSQTTKLIHGNIKSTNVLIDKSGNTRVSDFGLSVFASPTTSAVPRSNGYRAPEALDGRKLIEKSDVYAFGVLLLEMLTGKCPLGTVENNGGGVLMVDLPRWVQSVVREEWTAEVFDLELMRYKDIEEEMVGLLQIAMACTSTAPDQRPKMGYVVKMIDEIRGVEEVSPSHESSVDSVSNSPSVSDGTGVV